MHLNYRFLSSAALAILIWVPVNGVCQSDEVCGGIVEIIEAKAQNKRGAIDIVKHARSLSQQGKYSEALRETTKGLKAAIAEFGPHHLYVAYILDDMAKLHLNARDLDSALKCAKDAVAVGREAKGLHSLEYFSLQNTLATVLAELGRNREAVIMFRGIYEKFQSQLGALNTRTIEAAQRLGVVYQNSGRFEEALEIYLRAKDSAVAALGASNVFVGELWLRIANANLQTGDIAAGRISAAKAKQVYSSILHPSEKTLVALDLIKGRVALAESRLAVAERALRSAAQRAATNEKVMRLELAEAKFNLGNIQILKGKYVEAETLLKEALGHYREFYPAAHVSVGLAMHSLAIVYESLNLKVTAEKIYGNAIEIFENSSGKDSAWVAGSRLERTQLYTDTGRIKEAIVEAKAAYMIYEGLSETNAFDVQKGYARSALGLALHQFGDLEGALDAFDEGMKLIKRVQGPDSVDLAPGWQEKAEIYAERNNWPAAKYAIDESIRIRSQDNDTVTVKFANNLSLLSRIRAAGGDIDASLRISDEAVSIVRDRLISVQDASSSTLQGELRLSRDLIGYFAEITYSVQQSPSSRSDGWLAKAFEASQIVGISDTANAISGLSSRFAGRGSALGRLVRQRQDKLHDLNAADSSLTQALTSFNTVSNQTNRRNIRHRVIALKDELRSLDDRLKKEFPAFYELSSPKPASVGAVQNILRAGEALWLHFSTDKETYLFLVRQDSVTMKRSVLSEAELEVAVAALRAGLDLDDIQDLSDIPRFDVNQAHRLYRHLFAPFAAELEGITHIIAVPDRTMQNLPPSVLLMEAVAADPATLSAFKDLVFLGRRYAFSIAPSVSSFVGLRAIARPSKARKPFVGFGDPVLEGQKSGARGFIFDVIKDLVLKIDPALLRRLLPRLPATREELTALAQSLKAGLSSLFFAEQATETRVKATDLSQYRVLAFATHGLLAGEFNGLAEPALVMTPPDKATSTDDGLLTASEIAELKLDADWVLLSACNTAAPAGRPGAQGLSGLARSFFYAGSRSLLVSHWKVNSEAARLLTTGAFEELAKDRTIGRAEAIRRSMTRLMDGAGAPFFAHPTFWAPFVVVGEGG